MVTSKTENPDFETLMMRSLEGDKIAYGELLRATARLLRPYLSARLQNDAEIDDLMQEILLSIHKARHTYDGQRPYKPWVYAIARYRLQDHFRSYYGDKLRHAVDLAEIDLAAPVTETAIDYESIRGELAHLPEKQADILRLMYQEGYTVREVAEKMGMGESAVKVAAHRAYKALRKRLVQ